MQISFPSGRNTPSKKKQAPPTLAISFLLDRSLVSKRGNGHRGVVGERQCVGLTRSSGLTLDLDDGAVGLGLTLSLGVSLDSLEEVLTRSGLLDVLDSDVDSLLDVSVLDLLVDDDTDSRLGDVVDDTSLSVVDLEGHTLLDGTVRLNVDDISNAVLSEVGVQGNHTLLAEVPAEGIAGARSLSVGVTHLESCDLPVAGGLGLVVVGWRKRW